MYDIPVAPGNNTTAVDVAETLRVHLAGGIDKALAHTAPPISLGMRVLDRGEAVPGIVHHLTAAMQIGTEDEAVALHILDHIFVFLWQS